MMKKAIDEILQPLKDKAKEEEEEEEEEEENLQLGAFLNNEEEEEEDEPMDYNVTIDKTEMEAEDNNNNNNQHILDNHEISGFSFNVVTLPHLQHYFKKPFTYSGVDAGTHCYCSFLLLLLLLFCRLATV